METKECSRCKTVKPLMEYNKKKMGWLGHDSRCRECASAVNREKKHWASPKSKETKKAYKEANREAIRAKDKAYEQANAEKISARKKQYRIDNPELVKQQQKSNYEKNKVKRFEYHYNKKKTDPQYYLKQILRTRISNFLDGIGGKRGSAVADLGCTIPELMKHLESKFTEGMTWENRGKWHVDHIKPLSSFDLTKREEFLKACHYTNLQPLWAIDNHRKSDKV